MLNKRFLIIGFVLISSLRIQAMECEELQLQDSMPSKGFTYSPKSIYVDEENKTTYLHQVARLHKEDCQSALEKFLNLGCSLNDKNFYGQTPLHVAIIWGNISFIQNLFKFCYENSLNYNQLDLNTKDFNDNTGKTAFERCVDKWYLECNKNIDLDNFQKYADILVMFLHVYNTNIDPSYFPLHQLVSQSKIVFEKIKRVLDLISVEYLNLQDSYGETIAHKAARYGHDDLLKYLIESKANINIFNKVGRTPLHIAVLHNNFNIVDVLSKNRDCDVFLKDKINKTALDYAKAAIIFYTIVNEKELGYTDFHKWAKYAKPGNINALLNCKENLAKIQTTNGKLTPLHVAAINDKNFAAQAIIKNITENNQETNISSLILNLKDDYGNNPVFVAIACSSTKTSMQILSAVEDRYNKLLEDLEDCD